MCDVDEFESPNILFLKGVYIRNCKDVDDIMGERLAEIIANGGTVSDPNIQHKHAFDKIPQLFVNVEQWVKQTNVCCWECGCEFYWTPVFIPESISYSGTTRGAFNPIKPIGNFCTFICANMYVKSKMSVTDRWEKVELLKLLHLILTGSNILDIPFGPDRTEMIQYGGLLTVGEFQAKNKALCIQHNIRYPVGMFEPTLDDFKEVT